MFADRAEVFDADLFGKSFNVGRTNLNLDLFCEGGIVFMELFPNALQELLIASVVIDWLFLVVFDRLHLGGRFFSLLLLGVELDDGKLNKRRITSSKFSPSFGTSGCSGIMAKW